jgi:hypothetical protein
MNSTARVLLSARIGLDAYATNLEIRIHDGSRPWIITHAFERYIQDGPWPTAQYLAKRYLVSRPDQLQTTNLVTVAALLQAAMEEYELRDARA